MKTSKRASQVVLLAVFNVLATGCGSREVEANPCRDIDKISDPARKTERLTKCPRGGPPIVFKKPQEW